MKSLYLPLLLLFCGSFSTTSHATGIQPETSVVIVNEEDGEGVINLQNTDDMPLLLYTSLEDTPQDKSKLLIVSPPVARVEPHKNQMVRFILTSATPLKTERLKRVNFEGIPNVSKGKNEIRMSVRQNLPVIIHPKGLAKEPAPWKRLRWSHTDQNLTMRNDSPYIVRLSSVAKLLPSEQEVNLGCTYILPGEKLDIAVDDATAKAALQKSKQVEIFPATVYGYAVDKFDAPIENTTNAVENVVTAQASKIE